MSEERKIINYAVALVNEFAKKYNLSSASAYQFLRKFGAIDFIKEHYEIEHTLSFEEAVSDCMLICSQNGGELLL